MGDRGNVVVVERDHPEQGLTGRVYLYAHWGGWGLPETLQRALARRQRWGDGSYLARIIFCEMVRGHEAGELGFGISATLRDHEYPLLVVDPAGQTVSLEEEPKWYPGQRDKLGPGPHRWTFDAYCALDLAGRGWCVLCPETYGPAAEEDAGHDEADGAGCGR